MPDHARDPLAGERLAQERERAGSPRRRRPRRAGRRRPTSARREQLARRWRAAPCCAVTTGLPASSAVEDQLRRRLDPADQLDDDVDVRSRTTACGVVGEPVRGRRLGARGVARSRTATRATSSRTPVRPAMPSASRVDERRRARRRRCRSRAARRGRRSDGARRRRHRHATSPRHGSRAQGSRQSPRRSRGGRPPARSPSRTKTTGGAADAVVVRGHRVAVGAGHRRARGRRRPRRRRAGVRRRRGRRRTRSACRRPGPRSGRAAPARAGRNASYPLP